jgi:hypothetical protein
MKPTFHENLEREEDAKLGSDKTFGLFFASVSFAISIYGYWHSSQHWDAWLVAATLFLAASFLAPKFLRPLNFVWFRFGLLLHKFIGPLVMGVLFFFAFLPIGLLMRIFGVTPIVSKVDRNASTYWYNVPRDRSLNSSMTKQY